MSKSQMEFRELEALRKYCVDVKSYQVASLKRYYNPKLSCFFHRHDKQDPDRVSEASTSTCVLSLLAMGNWGLDPWGSRANDTARALLESDWQSADLDPKNAFTTAFVLEAVTALQQFDAAVAADARSAERIREAEGILLAALAGGYVRVGDYPASAYLTQLVVRVLERRKKLDDASASRVEERAWREIDRQLALLVADSKTADLFQLAYSIMLTATLNKPGEATPDENLLLRTALAELFKRQSPDGTWAQSRPLFHYPKVGSAYCYEYEMLVQLLEQEQLTDQLLAYLRGLATAAYPLRQSAYRLDPEALGWSSGHHPQFRGPESWSTASVFHFAHALDRLLAEAIRRAIFADLDAPYSRPRGPQADDAAFGKKFLDCELVTPTGSRSLRATVLENFVKPIAREEAKVRLGESLSENTPVSAIFFGPPGTSKTELTKLIADFLGWPRLVVDPSYFVRNGFDKVEAEADRLFSMLAVAEQVVVLLDEFDELVRDRGRAQEMLSRFLTTGMLPKLATINKNRKLVFIVATNSIGNFDLAISRHGRFDKILQVMPPTAEEKLRKWSAVAENLRRLDIDPTELGLKTKIAALTYDEFRLLAPSLETATTPAEAIQLIDDAFGRCTLNGAPDPDKLEQTWAAISTGQRSKIRA